MPTEYTAEQVLRAHTFALEALAGILVVSGVLSPNKMALLIESVSATMEAAGHTQASEYLRSMWAKGLNGEWEQAARTAGNIK